MAKGFRAEWLTLTEASKLTGIPARTLSRYIKQGFLKGKAVSSRLWIVRRREVESFERPKMGRPKKRGGRK
jgi:predicted site-specific integrase-resolvase